MKIAVLALCVVLPSICLCTPLPDYSAVADSNSEASVTGPAGANVSANSSSSSSVSINNPPAVTTPPPTPDPALINEDDQAVKISSNSNASANVQQEGNGGTSVEVDSSASASVTVTVGGHNCGQGDVNGFDKYTVVVKNQEDFQKISNTWMLWKSSSSTTKIETKEPVCTPRYLNQGCKYSEFKITAQSENEIFYEVWGSDGEKILYMKQKMSLSSQQYHIYSTQVLTITEVTNGSEEVTAVQNEQIIKEYFENSSSSFAILDYNEQYMICQTSSGVTFISVSQQVYESDDMKQQVSQKIDQVLKTNNLSSASFIEVSSKVDIDITKYQWDKCSEGGSVNTNKESGTKISVDANSSSSVDVENLENNSTGGKTNVKAEADSKSSVNIEESNGGDSCSGGTGKPTQQGFTNYSVLKISNDEFKSKIDKTTWFVAKYSQIQEEVKTDVTVCADRYICSSCFAVKFQYTQTEGCFVLKEWGYDGTNLIYIQENISFSTQDFVILKADVVNVMKATKDTDVAIGVENNDQVKSYLSSEYAVLYTDYKNFFIGQTSCDKGGYTFIAFIQEIYECEEKQQQFAQQISQILKESGIDESSLQKLSKKFDVDTNKYNKVKQETDVSQDGKTTKVKQETEQESGGGKIETETSVTNGPSSSPDCADINAHASSEATAQVNASPNNSGNTVDVESSSDANVKVNNVGDGTSPPQSTINANASSDSNASVDTTNGNVMTDVKSSSSAGVQVIDGSP